MAKKTTLPAIRQPLVGPKGQTDPIFYRWMQAVNAALNGNADGVDGLAERLNGLIDPDGTITAAALRADKIISGDIHQWLKAAHKGLVTRNSIIEKAIHEEHVAEKAIVESKLADTLNSRIDLIDGSGPGSVNARIQTETDARVAVVTQLSTTVDGNTSSIQTHDQSINGLEAQHTVKTDVNGHPAGIGLASTTDDEGHVTSAFLISADKFGMLFPAPEWQPNFTVAKDQFVKPTTASDKVYLCTVGGTTGTTEPTWPTGNGQTVTDGTATFQCVANTALVPFVITMQDGVPLIGMSGNVVIDGSLTGDKFMAKTIKAGKLDVPYLSAIVSNMGLLNAGVIQDKSGKFQIDLDAEIVSLKDAAGNTRMLFGKILDTNGDGTNDDYDFEIANAAGQLLFSASGLTALGTLIDCGGGNYAPQFAKTSANKIVPDGMAAFNLDLGTYVSADQGTGYDAYRVVNHKSDFWFDLTIGGDQPPGGDAFVKVYVQYQYDDGAWQDMAIGDSAHPNYLYFSGQWHRSLGFSFQFTSQATWNTLAFRVVLNNMVESARATVEVRNFVGASVKADNSVSGTTGVAKQADRHTYTLEDLPDSPSTDRFAAVEPDANNTESRFSKGNTVHDDPTEVGNNRPPSWYRANYPEAMAVEHKNRSAVGLPGSDTTVALETKVPTTGPVAQAGYTNFGFYVRTGTADDTGWTAWSSTSAETLSIDGFNNNVLTDGAQYANKATWIQLRDKPTTLSEFGLSEIVEPPLPDIQADEQILVGQSDGSKNWEARLQKAYANITIPVIAADQDLDSTTEADFGDTVVIPNPGIAVSLNVLAFLNCDYTDHTYVLPHLSVDGGATWARIGTGYSTNQTSSSIVQAAGTWSGTPTGDMHIKVRAKSASSVKVQGGGYSYISVNMVPYSGVAWYTKTAPLAISVDSPVYGSCSRYADNGTTCTASAQVPFRASGGSGGYSYSSAIVSGPGAITSGATTATPVVSDTATTADPYAQTTTGIHCTVTDSDSQSLTSDTASVILRFYRLYHPIHVSVTSAECSCTTLYTMQQCTASGTLSADLSGGSNPSPSWAKNGGAGAITSGASSTTVHVAATGFSRSATSGTFVCTGSDGVNPSGADAGTMSFSFKSIKNYPP